ncbi:MAG: DNA repair protein RadC [Bacteroidota bacterium]
MYANLPITAWALEDRPREKLLQRGINALTDAELIAILLGSGTRECSAIELARQLLDDKGGLAKLAKCSVPELTQLKGIGNAKAISLVAAFELGRRKQLDREDTVRIQSSADVASYMRPRMADLDHEVFHVIFLNRNNEIKSDKQLFSGGVSSTIIDPRIVFREAVNQLVSGIILVHNHPSGNLMPSEADMRITRKLVSGGKIMDIRVLDHLIISSRGYYSFADEGVMPE